MTVTVVDCLGRKVPTKRQKENSFDRRLCIELQCSIDHCLKAKGSILDFHNFLGSEFRA